ncbi:uncharacterized protein Dvir_GJ11558 [Drosophila virilis]|uniref:Fat-body protein 1 n=1 Tax=Drosophila virilis TaxID=7244 RepID=B4LFZ7_DROVI|nr:uncharacterized protein Dvir_GJ11558 [Drosophila virilis]
MNKLLVLVACVLGTVSAGRILQPDQRIERMSRQDLQRQKFLLDLVQRVQQPLQQDDLIQLDQGLIVDAQRYRGGIDGEMQRVIDLDRQRRLLDEHQIYSIRNVEHVQQLRGIYRLLVRALDFETLQRNVIYLRRNINPVLLINALTLAIRDREDTQILIMPAVQEILPELYLDQQTIEQVQRMQSEVEGSPRPSLMDLVGLGQRMRQINPVMRMVMPWRDLHMQMALRRQEIQQHQIQNRVVLPIQTLQGDQDISLLTEDIGLRNFMQNLIQELALLEDTTNTRQMLDMENDNDMVRQLEVEQRRQGNSDINNDRLLGVNRRRMQQQQNEDDNESENQRERVMVRNDEDDEEVLFGAQLPGSRVPLLRGIGQGIRRMLGGIREDRVGQEQTDMRGILKQDSEQQLTDNLQTVSSDDERLVHINRRRLGQPMDNMTPRRINPIGEGRRVGDMDTMKDEDIVQLIRKDNRLGHLSDEEIVEMVRRNRQGKEQIQQGQTWNIQRHLSQDEDLNRGTDNLQTVQRDDERLVHINRRRLGQPMDIMTPRRINPIGEGRRVGDMNTIKDDDIVQLIRKDNRLRQLSDEEIVEMLGRNRQRKEQTQQGQTWNIQRHLSQDEELNHGNENLQTVSRDDERLVHINRRRLDQPMDIMTPRRINPIGEGRRVGDMNTMKDEDIVQLIRKDNRLGQLSDEEIVEMVRRNRQRKEQTEKERFMGIVRDDRLSEGRRVNQVQLEQDQISKSRNEDWHRGTDNLETMSRDDEQLVHINRRRLNQPMDIMTPRRISPIGEGRRVDGEDTMKVEDIMQLIRRDNRLVHLSDDEIIEMLRRNRQRKEQEKQQNEDHTIVEQGHRYRRSLVNPMVEQTTRRSEMILHTLRQLLARLNQERIAGRLGKDEMQLIDNSRLIMPNQDQTQRYAVRLNEMRLDSRRNRVLIEQINAIEGRLQQVIGRVVREMGNGNIGVNRMTGSGVQQIDEQLRIESLIGDVLMGRLGDIGILRILRELLQDANVQLDRSGLGVSMGDRLLQHTLRRIISIVDDLREQQLGVYRREQLDMRDVTINAVRVGKLRTRIEDSDMDVSSLLDQPQQVQMMVRQRRLNNKPFTIDMDMSSERPQDVIVRLFLGPRQDAAGREVNLEQRRSDFVLLDAINTQLQAGRNRIQYRSTNIAWTTRDATPYSEIYRRVMTTLSGQQDAMIVNDLVGENGRFPQRLLLPRGRPEGLPMQLLVIVSPVERLGREQLMRMERIDGVMGMSMASIMDSRPLGFPLDRRIDNEQELLQLSNVQLEDVMIIHEN